MITPGFIGNLGSEHVHHCSLLGLNGVDDLLGLVFVNMIRREVVVRVGAECHAQCELSARLSRNRVEECAPRLNIGNT